MDGVEKLKGIITIIIVPVVLVMGILLLLCAKLYQYSINNSDSKVRKDADSGIVEESSLYDGRQPKTIDPDDYKPEWIEEEETPSSEYADVTAEDYIQSDHFGKLTGIDALRMLDSKYVADEGYYECHTGDDILRVFAEDRPNSFTNLGDVYFNVQGISSISFFVGMENGMNDYSTVRLYDDGAQEPVQEIEVEPGMVPVEIYLDLEEVSSLRIDVDAYHTHTVFFDIEIYGD